METPKSNVKISVRNYGPIKEAIDIELCPLTVFIGPSNTGKSYLAVLIYSLFHSFENLNFLPLFICGCSPIGEGLVETISIETEVGIAPENIDNWLIKLLKGDIKSVKLSDLPEGIKSWTKEGIKMAVNYKFHIEISRCMGIYHGKSLLSDKFNLNFLSDKFSLEMENDEQGFTLTLNSNDLTPHVNKNYLSSSEIRLRDLPRDMRSEREIERKLCQLLEQISEEIFSSITQAKPFCLPAGRTGLVETQQFITRTLIKQTALPSQLTSPPLRGIVSDFLEEIIHIDTSHILDPDVAAVADEIEKKILHGSIKTEVSEATQYPQFSYKQKTLKVPLVHSSSMVSELAPVVLFLRYKVKKGDLLIIEEPEAHLHPEAQRGIARTVVSLVRAGVRVMVTTHSDYFLDQLANHVRSSKLTATKHGSKLTKLEEEEVSAYVFNQREEGTIVERLHFDKENGLFSEDHDEVSSDLYNESIGILEKLDNIEHQG